MEILPAVLELFHAYRLSDWANLIGAQQGAKILPVNQCLDKDVPFVMILAIRYKFIYSWLN
jgi:hypothetical protein